MTQWAYFIPENKMDDREMKFVIICLLLSQTKLTCTFLKPLQKITALANEIWLSLRITVVLV